MLLFHSYILVHIAQQDNQCCGKPILTLAIVLGLTGSLLDNLSSDCCQCSVLGIVSVTSLKLISQSFTTRGFTVSSSVNYLIDNFLSRE